MKNNHLLQATSKFSGLFSIKLLFVTLSVYLSLYGELDETETTSEEIAIQETFSEELVNLDISSLIQQPVTQKEVQLPPPAADSLQYKSSFMTMALSFIFPGLGHAYLGDVSTAGGLIGTTGLGIGTDSFWGSNELIESTSGLTIETAWLYGMYAAYRDVRIYNRQSGYLYKMPTDSFLDLTLAPFNWNIIKKREVWCGLLVSLGIAMIADYFAFPNKAHIQPYASMERLISPLTAFPVGIGEEAFFRGFLMPRLSETFTPWGGIVLSSLLFSASHIFNAEDFSRQDRKSYYSVVLPLLAVSGIYDGWITHKNCSLKESVAMHAWYDFVLFAIDSIAGESIMKKPSSFCISFSF
jgi:membrane protease YdiL (CAAX protease family)